MADSPRYSLPYRRRREGKTDYKLRRALVKSGKPRAVVRLSNKYVTVQITDATLTGDIVRASASSRELPKLGWKGALGNLPAAYLTEGLKALCSPERISRFRSHRSTLSRASSTDGTDRRRSYRHLR